MVSGTISSLNLPAAWAAAVRFWLSRAYWSLALAADVIALGHDLGGLDHAHPQRGLDREQMFLGEMA